MGKFKIDWCKYNIHNWVEYIPLTFSGYVTDKNYRKCKNCNIHQVSNQAMLFGGYWENLDNNKK